MATLWSIHIATTLVRYASPAGEVATAIALVAALTVVVHVAKIITANETHNIPEQS